MHDPSIDALSLCDDLGARQTKQTFLAGLWTFRPPGS